jgi:hypothetical protein
MKLCRMLFLALAALLAGCSAYVVKRSTPAGDHKGIPFVVKTAACKHEVVRLEPYYVLTFTEKKDDKIVGSPETTVLSRSQFATPAVTNLRTQMAGANARMLWAAVRAMSYDPYLPESAVAAADWFVVSDKVMPEVYVDYEHPYTLNARRPLIGSVQATTKLNDDGTLSEGTTQSEDKTLSTLLDLVPAKELIKSAAGLAVAAVSAAPGASVFELAIEQKGVTYTRTYHSDDLPPCQNQAEVLAAPHDLVIADVTAEKKEKDDNTIQVNGSVKLPKPAAKGKDK